MSIIFFWLLILFFLGHYVYINIKNFTFKINNNIFIAYKRYVIIKQWKHRWNVNLNSNKVYYSPFYDLRSTF